MKFLSSITALLMLGGFAHADEDSIPEILMLLDPVFQSGAVFQQGMPIPVWGEAKAGSEIIVTFGDQKISTKADENDQWKVTLKALEADTLKDLTKAPVGKSLEVTATNDKSVVNAKALGILIGEVWLCSGQSNMAGKVKNNTMDPKDDLSKLNLPAIRQYRTDTGWTSATEDEVREFSKVGVTFARRLQQHLKVPVGILSASVGGTKIETWTKPDGDVDPTAKQASGGNYLKHIEPLVGTAMKGALWYQGEANVADGFAYYDKLDALIKGWREAWGQGDFPFLIVQLAGIGISDPNLPEMGDGRAAIREAQFQAMKRMKHVGLATAVEIGGPKEHPPNKTDIGKRLAAWALHHQYERNITPSGPIYLSHERRCSTIAIQFENGKGLAIADKEEGFGAPTVCADDTDLPWVSIQDHDGVWHWAMAWVEGDELLVHNADVKHPIAVRYAWTNRPKGPYLYNKAGLPTFPFTTEKWEELIKDEAER